MKNDLTCAVVRDLLPSYVEGLTSEETNRAVDAHLADCADCTARKNAMAAPEETAKQAANAKEVDYLKKVKRGNGRRVALAVVCTALVILALFGLKVFYIGTQAQEQGLEVLSATVDGDNTLHLHISSPWSGTAYHTWKAEQTGGRVDIWCRQVTASPLYRESSADLGVPLGGVEEIYLCGRLIWQDGVVIPREVMALYNAKTPYVGDASALSHIAAALQIESKCGLFTNELQTAGEPYGWTLNFTSSMLEGRGWYLNLDMEAMAPLMLALVDNLGEVTWTYTDTRGGFHTRTVTVEDANTCIREHYERLQELGVPDLVLLDSVKDYSSSPANLWRLCDILPMNWPNN